MKSQLTIGSLIIFVLALLLPATIIRPQGRVCPPGKGTVYQGCPACGSVQSVKVQEDNLLKNRDEPAVNPTVLTVNDLRNPANDKKFFPDMAVEVTGYVDGVVAGGLKETCNCIRADLRDVVIKLVAKPSEAHDPRKYVILEISPRWESKLNLDDSSYSSMLQKVSTQMTGKWVTFRGWMFQDSAHLDQSESTNPGNPSNWRATAWEIHPVTYYNVLPRQPR
jgi:predicted  nucleic acid-binding Zn-ribbon protein